MTTLFRMAFGRNIGTSGHVSDADFYSFLESEVTPDIKGFTLYDATGYWEGKREPSIILEVVGEHTLKGILEDIARTYCERFNQESVLVSEFPFHFAELVSASEIQKVAA